MLKLAETGKTNELKLLFERGFNPCSVERYTLKFDTIILSLISYNAIMLIIFRLSLTSFSHTVLSSTLLSLFFSESGMNIAMVAAKNYQMDILDLIMKKKLDLSVVDNNGMNILHYAVQYHQPLEPEPPTAPAIPVSIPVPTNTVESISSHGSTQTSRRGSTSTSSPRVGGIGIGLATKENQGGQTTKESQIQSIKDIRSEQLAPTAVVISFLLTHQYTSHCKLDSLMLSSQDKSGIFNTYYLPKMFTN